MISGLIALQLVQARPIAPLPARATLQPNVSQALISPTQRRLIEARELLAKAEGIQLNYAPGPGQPSKAQLDRSIERMKAEVDSMSEMGEMESLRLQMAMDRMSKMMTALSNIVKKISDTQNGIVQNIK